MSEPTRINILAESIMYKQWCEENDLSPADDESYNAYCEWKANLD